MHQHLHYRGLRRQREREEARQHIQDIIAQNSLNLGKDTDIQVQEAKRVPNRMNPKSTTQKDIVINMSKFKD